MNNEAETFNLRMEPIRLAVAKMKMRNFSVEGNEKRMTKSVIGKEL